VLAVAALELVPLVLAVAGLALVPLAPLVLAVVGLEPVPGGPGRGGPRAARQVVPIAAGLGLVPMVLPSRASSWCTWRRRSPLASSCAPGGGDRRRASSWPRRW
jgi:hypothetical protein